MGTITGTVDGAAAVIAVSHRAVSVAVACLGCALVTCGASQRPDYTPPEIRRLTARTLRVFTAPEATQGAANDARHFYAIGNTVIAKYDIASGRRVGEWAGP